jgi:hypothetical protein
MPTPKIIPRADGGGSLGAATYGWGAGFITDITASSAIQGGGLTLTANDGAGIEEYHRLGVVEFKGSESASALTTGAKIETIVQYMDWSTTNNWAKLSFSTSYGNAGIAENVNIGGNTAMSVFNDYATTTFETQLNAVTGERFGGEILRYNPGTNIQGNECQIHFLETDGDWYRADASGVATGGSQLLCLPSALESGDLLMKGFVRVPFGEILNTPAGGAVDGLPVYVSTTAGNFDFTAPSGSGDYVRIVGYAIDDFDTGSGNMDVLVYFDPDKTFVEIT